LNDDKQRKRFEEPFRDEMPQNSKILKKEVKDNFSKKDQLEILNFKRIELRDGSDQKHFEK
jgi:hypothetical protein